MRDEQGPHGGVLADPRARHATAPPEPAGAAAPDRHGVHAPRPRLEFLEIAGIGPELKEEDLVRLLNTTPRIRRLDLEDVCDITDAVLDAQTPPMEEVRYHGVQVPVPQPRHALIRAAGAGVHNTRVSQAVLREFVRLARQRRVRGAKIVAVDFHG